MPSSKTLLFSAYLTVALLFVPILPASAGTISLQGTLHIETALSAGPRRTLKVSGYYSALNAGTDSANDTTPRFYLADWTWSGEARTVRPNETLSWTVDKQIPIDEPCDEKSMNCLAGAAGIVPFRLLCQYKDSNGYSYSTTQVNLISLGDTSADPGLEETGIDASLTLPNAGPPFTGELRLRNNSLSSARSAHVSYFTSNEIEVKTPAANYELDPGASKSIPIQIENHSGLPGSTYVLHAIVESTKGKKRGTAVVSHPIRLNEQKGAGPSTSSYFFFGALFVLIVQLIFFYFARSRKAKLRQAAQSRSALG